MMCANLSIPKDVVKPMALRVPVGNWKILSLSMVIPRCRCFYIVISGAVQLAVVPIDQQFRHSLVFIGINKALANTYLEISMWIHILILLRKD